MANSIKFTAELICPTHFLSALSGRLGDFIFRTYPNGKICAFYSPKHRASSSRSRDNLESISSRFRAIIGDLQLEIVRLNFNTAE